MNLTLTTARRATLRHGLVWCALAVLLGCSEPPGNDNTNSNTSTEQTTNGSLAADEDEELESTGADEMALEQAKADRAAEAQVLAAENPALRKPTPLKTIMANRSKVPKVSGFAMHGEPDLDKDWQHLPYVNPKAPKGGKVSLPAIGTFDSLNPYISKGTAAEGLELIYDTLTQASMNEPFSVYGLVAKTMQIPADRTWVIFQLDPNAAFHDGHVIDAGDVVFSFNTLTKKGQPLFQLQFLDVLDVQALNKHEVLFRFKHGLNRELPLVLGQLPVLPEHSWKSKDFTKPGLTKPLGSGPYTVGDLKPGKFIRYQRFEDYWAKDHPLNVGRYNFDQVGYEYFAESNIALEAFRTGEYTFRAENNSKFWATSYEGQKFKDGTIEKTTVATARPVGMQGFVMNLRKPLFQDPALREALGFAFNFEWSNENLFYSQYKRTRSFFENTELAATKLPSKAELRLLEPLKDQLPERVFTQVYQPPSNTQSGDLRGNLRHAKKLLQDAGYTLERQRLISPDDEPVRFEILLYDTGFERIVLPFIENLKRLGIHAQARRIDVNQYIERMRDFDFDMLISTFPQSLSPGGEQRNYWHSSAVDRRDSRNLAGIKSKAIDKLIEHVVLAKSREDLITASRALDRALQWSFIVIPNWHVSYDRLAYWPPITEPEKHPKYNLDLNAWWSAP